jgi:hypothetical protein
MPGINHAGTYDEPEQGQFDQCHGAYNATVRFELGGSIQLSQAQPWQKPGG